MTSTKSVEQLGIGEKGYVRSNMIYKENGQIYIEGNALVMARNDGHVNTSVTYTAEGFVAKTIEKNVGKRYIDPKTKKCLSENVYPVICDFKWSRKKKRQECIIQ